MINEEGEVIAIEVKEDEEEVLDCNSMGLCGITESKTTLSNNPPTTLRLKGSLNGISIVVLIDSGASHNFVSPHVATNEILGWDFESYLLFQPLP